MATSSLERLVVIAWLLVFLFPPGTIRPLGLSFSSSRVNQSVVVLDMSGRDKVMLGMLELPCSLLGSSRTMVSPGISTQELFPTYDDELAAVCLIRLALLFIAADRNYTSG